MNEINDNGEMLSKVELSRILAAAARHVADRIKTGEVTGQELTFIKDLAKTNAVGIDNVLDPRDPENFNRIGISGELIEFPVDMDTGDNTNTKWTDGFEDHAEGAN